jgi:hypothetical protein
MFTKLLTKLKTWILAEISKEFAALKLRVEELESKLTAVKSAVPHTPEDAVKARNEARRQRYAGK